MLRYRGGFVGSGPLKKAIDGHPTPLAEVTVAEEVLVLLLCHHSLCHSVLTPRAIDFSLCYHAGL